MTPIASVAVGQQYPRPVLGVLERADLNAVAAHTHSHAGLCGAAALPMAAEISATAGLAIGLCLHVGVIGTASTKTIGARHHQPASVFDTPHNAGRDRSGGGDAWNKLASTQPHRRP